MNIQLFRPRYARSGFDLPRKVQRTINSFHTGRCHCNHVIITSGVSAPLFTVYSWYTFNHGLLAIMLLVRQNTPPWNQCAGQIQRPTKSCLEVTQSMALTLILTFYLYTLYPSFRVLNFVFLSELFYSESRL